MATKGYALSIIGSREQNQDAYLMDDPRGIYAVADGVGGGLHGEIASRMAVDGLQIYATASGSLKSTVLRLQEDILKESMETLGEALMGTTLTAVRVEGTEVFLTHVGDSHCYHFVDGLLRLKTEDHESYDDSLQGPVLSSYLGIPSDIHPLTIQEDVFSVAPGDRLLFCSDGLYRQIEEVRITELMRQHGDTPEEFLKRVCDEAARAERSDNITVVLVEIS